MTGYTRTDVTNQIANGNMADATYLNQEYDAIQAAFSASTGHTHDGTAGNGGPISVLGPTKDVSVTPSAILPRLDNTVSLGSASLEFRDLWIDGVANIDSLVADTANINAGAINNVTIGNITPGPVTGTTFVGTTFAGTSFTGALNGNADTATTLQTPRLINGTSFNGSSNIVTTNWGTARTITIGSTGKSVNGSANVSWSLSELGVGSLGQQNSNAVSVTGGSISGVNITGGSVTGITDLAIADGGTGASTAAQALINLGVTATASELNKLSGVTTTTTQLNHINSVTSNVQTQLNNKQSLDATLTSLAALDATSGVLVQTATDTFAKRTITGTANQVTVSNGNGVSGNPTISLVLPSQPEAEAGTDVTKPMTAIRVEQHMLANALGWGQTWLNVIASRTFNTSYQNTTGRPIMVSVRGYASDRYMQVSPDNSTWVDVGRLSPSGSSLAYGPQFIVPDQHYYRTSTTGAAGTIEAWAELR